VETPDMLKRGLASLNEAMGVLPSAECMAYEEAVRRAPRVVKAESDPLQWLRFEEFNGWAASKRLAIYWSHRVQYFGATAFLPLTQTMGGALWEEDLQTLAAGFFFFLPPDSRGRPVLCCDPSKFPGNASTASRIRVAMYFFSILCCEYPVSITEGCLLLFFVRDRGITGVLLSTREMMDVVLDAFPIKNCETHVIYPPSPRATLWPSFSAVVLPLLVQAIGRLLVEDRSHFHVGDTPDGLECKLASFGLVGAGLQAAVRGEMSNEEFGEWMKERQYLETQRWSHTQQQQEQQIHKLPMLQYGESSILQIDERSSGQTRRKSESSTKPAIASQLNEDMQTKNLPMLQVGEGSSGQTNRKRKPPPKSAGDVCPSNKDGVYRRIELLPGPEKEAYFEALQKVPDLVRKESDPTRFLETENGDTFAAAKRLAAYWRIRHEAFRERAFLPMDQTGEGSLDRQDITLLQSGFLAQLPNDDAGCTVICCDTTRLNKKITHSAQMRIFFYLWSVASQNDFSQKDGCSVIYTTMPERAFLRAFAKCFKLAMEAHPVKLKRLHLLFCSPEGVGYSDAQQGSVADLVELLDGSVQEKVLVHACGSRAEFAGKLIGSGMSREGLPMAFGGTWGWEDFVQWQEACVRNEWILPIRSSLREVAERYLTAISTARPASILSADEKKERTRRLNVIRSRSIRERKRVQVNVLREQCSELEEDRKKLLREGRKLGELFQKAEAIVNGESNEDLLWYKDTK
jgi:hypothetical protein